MAKWTNNEGKIFESEDAARDFCLDSVREEDIIEVIKDAYIESYYELFMDALKSHDFWEYGKLQDDIFDKVWEDLGFREIEKEGEE